MKKPAAPKPVCAACGGSGVEFKPYGPFYTSVPRRWRQVVQDHTEARHEVFRVLDREIARQVIPLAKDFEKKAVSIAEILVEADIAHGKAVEAHVAGDTSTAVRSLVKVATSAIYVLESLEIELGRNRKPEE